MCIPCVMCGACFDTGRDERPLSCPECKSPLPPDALCCPACHTFIGGSPPNPPETKGEHGEASGNGSAPPPR